jgi:uncharacterized protein YjbI with pentapeptide repeats
MNLEHVFTANEKAELSGELFVASELVGIDLSGADLRGAIFERSVLVHCSLAGADLRSARFVHCELHAVDLTGALLVESRFDATTFDELVTLAPEDRAHVERSGGTFVHRRASLR